MDIQLYNLTRFFPYESAHTSHAVITLENTGNSMYNAIEELLEDYEPDEYFNCSPGYFNLHIDNKITLELESKDSFIYLTYWDGKVHISSSYYSLATNAKYCTVKIKRY